MNAPREAPSALAHTSESLPRREVLCPKEKKAAHRGVVDIECIEEAQGSSENRSADRLVTQDFLQIQREEFRKMLEEWGQKHMTALLEALRQSTAAECPSECPTSWRVGQLDTILARQRSPGPSEILQEESPLQMQAIELDNVTQSGYSEGVASPKFLRESQRSSGSLEPLWGSEVPWKDGQVKKLVAGHLASKPHEEVRPHPVVQCLFNMVEHPVYGVASAIVITMNACFIGWLSDAAMTSGNTAEPPSQWVHGIEQGFTAFFTFEVVCRILAYGRYFFTGGEWQWNVFDLGLVLHSLMEYLETFSSNTSFLRVVRLARMLKLLRVIRLVRGLRELRFILNSILGSVRSTVWSLMLVFVFTYTFGLVFLQAAAGYLAQDDVPLHVEEGLRMYWGSLTRSMLSLLMASTGGEDWGPVAQPLLDIGLSCYFIFLFYLISFLFIVMNTVTGLFVEATMNQSTQDHALIIQAELDKKNEYIAKLQDLFDEMDLDKDGMIDALEFTGCLDDPRMQAFVTSLNIDASDAMSFFKMLSSGSASGVDLETFVVGCIKLRGEARSMDIFALQRGQAELEKVVTRIEHLLSQPALYPSCPASSFAQDHEKSKASPLPRPTSTRGSLAGSEHAKSTLLAVSVTAPSAPFAGSADHPLTL